MELYRKEVNKMAGKLAVMVRVNVRREAKMKFGKAVESFSLK